MNKEQLEALRAAVRAAQKQEDARLAKEARDAKAAKAKIDPKLVTQHFEVRGGLVLNDRDFDKMVRRLAAAEVIYFDTEADDTRNEQPGNGLSADRYAVSWQFGIDNEWVWYVPVRHREGPNYRADRCAELFQDIINERSKAVVAHNIAFDINTAANEGVDVDNFRAQIHDTVLLDWLIDPSQLHRIEEIIMRRYGWRMGSFKQFQLAYGSMAFVPVRKAVLYGLDDVRWLPRLLHDSLRELRKDPLSFKAYMELELPIVHVTARMNRMGSKIDTGMLMELDARFARVIDERHAQLSDLMGTPLSEMKIGSTQWLAHTMIKEREDWAPFADGVSAKTGMHSTAKKFMAKWAAGMPRGTTPVGKEIAGRILDVRKLSKLRSTYTTALVGSVARDGRVHASFNQTGAVTGRFSCAGPNLMNIPIRSDEGAEIRRAFVAAVGWVLLDGDYSQIELRLLAHFCGDPSMMAVYAENGDIHQMTADEIGCSRDAAKGINFGLMYGMGPGKLAETIREDVETAKKFLARYFDRFSAVRDWKYEVIERARRDGFTSTITGRKRYLPHIRSRDGMLRSRDERIAVNTKIQGSAADVIKIGMRNADREIAQRGLRDRLRMLVQVHDELLFEVREDFTDEALELVKRNMEGAVKLRVPLVSEPKIGPNWLEAH